MAAGTSGSWLAELARVVSHANAAYVGTGILALAVSAAVAAYLAWRYLQHVRLIQDTPTAKARSVHQGYVELEGVARMMDDNPVIALLSGLPCAWYRYTIEEQVVDRYRGQARTRWKVVDRGASRETFWLEDETGRVAVDPEGAEITPKYKDVWVSRSTMTGIARQSEFIAGYLATHSSATTYRFTEERINRGDRVYAIGLVKNLGSHVNGLSVGERVREILRQWKQDQPVLHERFDLDQDGNIDNREWLLARRMARREAERARTREFSQMVEGVNLLTTTGDRQRPYLISAYPQTELVRRYLLTGLLSLAGFFVFGSVAVWLFNTRFV